MDNGPVVALAQRYGQGETREVCPFCSHERKKKRIKDLSLTIYEDRVVYYCHHCEEHGAAALRDANEPVTPIRRKPMAVAKPIEKCALSAELTEYLKTRAISPETAEGMGCFETHTYFPQVERQLPAIAFNYFNKGRPYAQKLRSYPDKWHVCNGSPQTLYNAHNQTSWEEVIIVEGEFDAVACKEAGIQAVSVPHGALNKKPEPNDRENGKLNWLKHHSDDLKDTKRVTIFCDGDDQGEILADEVARRIGRDRCFKVHYPEDCKDANDILVKHGPEALKEAIANAKPWPIEGLHDADYFTQQVMDMYHKGLGKGEDTGLPELDNYYSVMPGQLTIVTGHPSNGKSELVDQLMVHLAENKAWKFAICSFENEPRLHIANLISKFIRLPFFNAPGGRMSAQQRDEGLKFVRRHFAFLYNDDGDLTTLDSIIERLKVAVLRHGIRGCVIDPYNYIAKSGDKSETDWVSEMLSRIRKFAQAHGIHVWFVAHPTKMQTHADGTLSVPKGNDISGSAAWWAKADMGITVHRPDPVFSNETDVHVWKSRYSWCGKQGVANILFNDHAHRYCGHGEIVKPKTFATDVPF